MKTLEIASASVLGKLHRQQGKNNQDAYRIDRRDDYTIAVVADGCGSCPHSEVGAHLGVNLVVESILSLLSEAEEDQFWVKVQHRILQQLELVIRSIWGDPFPDILREYFFFSFIGVLITPSQTVIFSVGDGVIVYNGEITCISPDENNAPPYLVYHWFDRPDLAQWKIHHQFATSELQSLVISTDGFLDLLQLTDHESNLQISPLKQISQLWEDDRYFRNPQILSRHLQLMNKENWSIDWKNQQINKTLGNLNDDTTIIVIRQAISS